MPANHCQWHSWVHTYLVCCAGILSKPRWVRLLSSGLLLWCSLSGRWAIGTTLLASAVSAVLCYDTIGTPVATKLTQVALNNTYITGSFYRGVMVVSPAIFLPLTLTSPVQTAIAAFCPLSCCAACLAFVTRLLLLPVTVLSCLPCIRYGMHTWSCSVWLLFEVMLLSDFRMGSA